MLKQKIAIITLLLLFAVYVQAQQEPSFAHYWALEPSFNPAAVGKEDKLNVTGAYAMTLTGFENAPRTMQFGADMPFYALRSYHGAGVYFMNDKIGLFSHQRLSLQYAYKHKLFGGMLSVGAQFGFLSEDFDASKLDVEDASDPAFASGTGNSFDLGAGFYYNTRSWYAGFSVQHLTSPLIEIGDKNELQVDRTYYLTGGCNITLHNPFLTIKPSVLARTDGVAYRVDVTGRVEYHNDGKKLFGGVAYSPANSVTFLVGGTFHGIVLGYSYELYTSAISPGNGSHELYIGYQHNINLVKKGKNLHKSVRIL